MATTTLQVRIDSDLKKETEATLKSMGLSMSTAIHLFCQQLVNYGRIPFEIIAAPKLKSSKRIGVAKGKFAVPDDFDKWDANVADVFEGYL